MNLMQRNTARAGVGAGIAATMLAVTVLLNIMPAAALQSFADPAFERVWDRTDSPEVLRGTYFWGPAPGAALLEEYLDAPSCPNNPNNCTRLVQYFDKSRMEINNPNADRNSTFYVTNGLLTVELISGKMQIGNNAFVQRISSNIPVAGDTYDTQAPTYTSFRSVSNTSLGDHRQPSRVGLFATATIDNVPVVGNDPAKAAYALARIAYFEPSTGHNIPAAFWNFLNSTGPVKEGSQIVNKRLIDPWFYASGLPISDPYWASVIIGGKPRQSVMIQAFERRVLTYVPSNDPNFQVEMGNIGQHYYDWRYKDQGPTPTPTRTAIAATATPTATPVPPVPTDGFVIFISNRSGVNQIWRVKPDGVSTPEPITPGSLASCNVDYAVYSPNFNRIAFTANCLSNGGGDDIYVMVLGDDDGKPIGQPRRLTTSSARDFNPTWSPPNDPNGSRIAFVSTTNNNSEIWVMRSDDGSEKRNITNSLFSDTDPSWGANGYIAFTSNRSGFGREIYIVNPDSNTLPRDITGEGENFLPRWNHRGDSIVFVSTRNGGGRQDIYSMRADGGGQTRLTNNASPDRDPAYAYNDNGIVFAEAQGDLELWTMNLNGGLRGKIASKPSSNEYRPDWGNLPVR